MKSGFKGKARKIALGGLISGLLGLVVVCLLAAMLVWPLWYLATVHSNLYTILSVFGFTIASVYVVAMNIIRKNAEKGRDL